jgi:hypothetical protein
MAGEERYLLGTGVWCAAEVSYARAFCGGSALVESCASAI